MRRILWICVVLLFSNIGQAAAQDSAPLFMISDGYLYAWTANSGLQQLTDRGTVDGLALSPDGTQLAYAYYPDRHEFRIPVRALDSGGQFYPSDIFMRDVATGQTAQLTQQPAPDEVVEQIVRTAPVWSPDGALLLWNEHAYGPDTLIFRVISYQRDNGETRILPGFGAFLDAGMGYLGDIEWGGGGYMSIGSAIGPEHWVIVRDVSGEHRFGRNIGTHQYGDSFAATDIVDLTDNGRAYIGVYLSGLNVWNRLDFETDETQMITDGVVALYNRHAPDRSLNVYYDNSPSETGSGEWIVLSPDGEEQIRFRAPYDPARVTLSPDGSQFVYADDTAVYIWDGSQPQAQALPNTANTTAVAWGITGWRVVRGAGLGVGDTYLAPLTCESPNSHLAAGAVWRSELGLTRYSGVPFVDAAEIPEGTSFTVLDTPPVCISTSMSFWQVEMDGQIAWIEDNAAASSYRLIQCPGSAPTRLTYFTDVQVIPDTPPNNLRAEPSTSSEILAEIPAGEPFRVYTPRCAEGLTWWRADYDGVQGWTAEGQGNDYWLEPLP